MSRKCCLVVLDGWGYNEKPENITDGIILSDPVNMYGLTNKYSSYLLYAHGKHVGLSSNDMMGNSEVGHLTIGAGRVIEQDSVRIRNALSREPSNILKPVLSNRPSIIHILGILSDGCIHGDWKDIRDMAIECSKSCSKVYIHSISDGRDTRPKEYLNFLEMFIKNVPENVWVVSVSGRFYTMDRDKREERTEEAYRTITEGNPNSSKGETRINCIEMIKEYVEKSYSEGVTDEFIRPFCLNGRIEKNDTVVISNFRIDRVKQIYNRLNPFTNLYTMTRVCDEQHESRILFSRPSIINTLGEVIENNGLNQVRIAETEKKAHVTFFFDGGNEKPKKNEKRIIHSSDKVETFDLAPEMKAKEISESVCESMKSGVNFILANFANCDMVGHTGSLSATVKGVKTVDKEIRRIYEIAQEYKYSLIITADHGNAEIMKDLQGVVKSHTLNRVPLIIITEKTKKTEESESKSFSFEKSENYTLADVAPTVLELMQLEKPEEMTGRSLLPVCDKV